MTPRRQLSNPAIIAGRQSKAEQFANAFDLIHTFADELGDVADACVTLAVHAGIAASDVVCCVRLGEHATGENHREAISLLGQVDAQLAKHLATLLEMKSKAGYGHVAVAADSLKRAQRAMDALLSGMRAI